MTEIRFLLRDLFAAGDAGDLDRFVEFLHEDVVVHAPAGLSTVGLENEKDSWRKARAAVPDIKHEFLESVSDGSTVAALCVVSGTLYGNLGSISAQGRHFCLDQALFAHVRDGKINELWEIVDTASLVGHIGASHE